MWNLFSLKTQILVMVILTAVLVHGIGAAMTLFGAEDLSLLRKTSLAASLIGVVVVAFGEMAWRPLWRHVPWLGRKLFPDCNGRWEGELHSTWKDASGQRIPPIPVKFWIFQHLFTTHVRMATRESSSESTRCWMEADPASRRYTIGYTYRNTPGAKVSERSMQHDGVAWLTFDHTASPPRLAGRYCTTRHTSGDIDVRRMSADPDSPIVHPSMADAQ